MWLVWDLNQLFHNKYADKDPWGGDLPEDMAARAGKKILPNDMCVVTWGSGGDMDYFYNDLGLPHQTKKNKK